MSRISADLEGRYVAVKTKGADVSLLQDLEDCIDASGLKVVDAVVIEADWPGYEVACGIAIHGRICRRLSACTCTTQEQRDPCFDWVKV